MKTVALITPIEQNKEVKIFDGSIRYRQFEEESVRMVKSWRQRGGYLKDIPIYVFNVNGCNPKPSIIDQLKKLGCIYFERYAEESKKFEYGFLNEPLCGVFAENELKEEILLKIDLDMQLLKPIDRKFVEIEDVTMVGRYSDVDSKDQRHGFENFIPFDTSFMVSNRNTMFYHKYYDYCFNKEMLESSEYKNVKKTDGLNNNYYQEEFAIDYIHKNNIMKIVPILNYTFGEGYKDIEQMDDSEVDQIYFLHGHLYNDNRFYDEKQYKMKYIKRICNINANKFKV